jgi:hypothetical protein
MKFKQLVIGAAAGFLGILAAPASADLEFIFDNGGSVGSGPFGSVLLHQVMANEVEVTITLNPGVGFVNTGLEPFTFSLASGIPQLTAASFSSLTTGFSLSSSIPFGNNDGAGAFQYGLDCTTTVCGNGGGAPFAGPLHFFLTAAGLQETSFVGYQNNPNTFSIDICNSYTAGNGCAGATGAAWATGGTPPPPPPQEVPEPQTLVLLTLGLLGVALIRKQSRV